MWKPSNRETIAVLILIVVLTMWIVAKASTPRLVGYDCEGASAPLYADEEDELPACSRIESVNASL
jgi:hypothetical protein